MRILVDYRPALRDRTGAGEYVHELIRAYTGLPAAREDAVTLFTSSWKDRPRDGLAAELNSRVVDRRLPVAALNYLWHRLEWPPVEWVAGDVDVAHAAHPLMIPTRKAAQVVTIHDLFFMTDPQRTHGEIRRDYPELTPAHAQRADSIITSSRYTAGLIAGRLGIAADRVYVCSPGAPRWSTLGHAPNIPADGYILFLGTLEPRKNIGLLLDAYERLLAGGNPVPRLVLAGRATADAGVWLARMRQTPLAGHVEHRGYVPDRERERLYAGARLLVMPSLDEGFGLPVLEAMSAGVPVVASSRGSLPEVLGGAGSLVDAENAAGLADAIARMLEDEGFANACAARGLQRAAEYSWPRAAAEARRAYVDAVVRRRARSSNGAAR